MLVPAFVLIPILAGVGDRIPRSRALSLTHAAVAVTSALTGVLLLVDAPFWVLLVIAAALNVALGVARPMHYALLPLLARSPGELVRANAASSSLDGITLFVGFLLAGSLTDVLGAWTVLLLCAVLSVGAAFLTAGLRTSMAPLDLGDVPGRIKAALAGFVQLRRSPGAIALLVLMGVMAVVEGANDTLTVTFNDEVLGLSETSAGLIAGAYGVGLAIGGGTLASVGHRRRLAPVVLGGTVLMGATQASIALLGSLWPVVVLLMVVGVGVSLVEVGGRTLLQRSTEDAILARVMGVQEGSYLVGLTIGAAVGPLLVAWLGARRAFVPLGLFLLVFGLVFFSAVRRLERHAVPNRAEVALLRGVPFLAALQPYELQRLAQHASWVQAPPGTAVVTQGELGDSYFVVASGQLSVTTGATLKEHRMLAGDGFGEIALLHHVPRTATIRAVSDARLLRVSGEDFLATVVPNVDGSRLARAVAEDRWGSDRGLDD